MQTEVLRIDLDITDLSYHGRMVLPSNEIRQIELSDKGMLTGSVEHIQGRKVLKVQPDWSFTKDILSGYLFLSGPGFRNRYTIERYDPHKFLIYLRDEYNGNDKDETFGIQGNEKIPLFVSRLLCQCSIRDPLPCVKLNINIKLRQQAVKNDTAPILIISGDQEFPVGSEPMFRSGHLLELDERIDSNGVIKKELRESEINRVLKAVYRLPRGTIVLALRNSAANPVHEQTLSNLLRTAGYQHVYTSYQAERLLTVLHYFNSRILEQFLKPVVDGYLNELNKKLGKDSVIKINYSDPVL